MNYIRAFILRIKWIVRIVIIILARIYSVLPARLRIKSFYFYKKNKFPQDDSAIAFVFDSHWNSVESFLPVLHWAKERMGYRIIVFWGAEDESRLIQGNEFYFEALMRICDVAVLNKVGVVEPTKYENSIEAIWLRIKEIFSFTLLKYSFRQDCMYFFQGYNVKAVLRVCDNDEQSWEWLYSCFPLAKHIVHPHAFMGMFNLPDADWLSYYEAKSDVIVWTDEHCLTEFLRILGENDYEKIKNRLFVVGMPRYDMWWLKKIRTIDQHFVSFENTILSHKGKKVIIVCMGRLTILNPEYTLLLEEPEVTIQELTELKEFFLRYKGKDVFFVFKFHPSTALYSVDLNIFFQKYCPDSKFEYQVTDLPLAAISQYANLVISAGISSVAMESVAVGIPTIEFHEKRKSRYWYRCPDESYGSFLKLHQLALYASDSEELIYWTNLVFGGKVHWADYYKKLQKYITLDGCASKRFGDIIQRYARVS